jgi:outer membrane protein assembly factor BamA
MLRNLFNSFLRPGIAVACACACALIVHAQGTKGVRLDYEDHGSVPPVSDWYACGRKLDGLQSYDPAEGEKCLKEILNHGHFKSGHITVSSTASGPLVIFVLESPPLKLSHIDYGISKEMKSDFEDYLVSTPFIPRVGQVYDARNELSAANRIEQFFAAEGFQAAVSKRVDLNYANGTASIAYRIWEGPESASVPLPRPSDCEVAIGNFSMFDVDDFTPLELILRSTHMHLFSCYSERAIQQDEEILKNLKIFTAIRYSVDGDGNRRSVSVHARSKPLIVTNVLIDGLGLMSTHDLERQFGNTPDLPVQTNRIYRQSEARESIGLLEEHFNGEGVKARIFEDDETGSDSTLRVTFHVLTYPLDELYIDGQRME